MKEFGGIIDSGQAALIVGGESTIEDALGKADRGGSSIARRACHVARYLPSRLTVPEIAHELGVSTRTLKTHLKSLYRKLEVTSRVEAVDVARDVGILR